MKKSMLKFPLLLIIASSICLYFAFDLEGYLSIEGLQSGREWLHQRYATQPTLLTFVFFIIYILMTAMSLPGSIILTLAGGFLFGWWKGIIIVSFASAIGATCALLISRYLLRDYIERRYGKQLQIIDTNIKQYGVVYLLSLRLNPFFPFILINILMGLTPMSPYKFYWATQIGLLPLTSVYVLAGSELGRIHSVTDLLSPQLLVAFVVMSLLPLTAKFVMKKT